MVIKFRFAAVLALSVLVVGCRQFGELELDRQLIGEVVMHSELAANLRALCVPGGRLSGTASGRQAEEYVAEKLRAYGLDNVHFEPFAMTSWQDRETVVTVMDDPPRRLAGALALGNCLSTPPEGLTGDLVDVGEGGVEAFRAAGERLRGRFALVREGGLHRGKKMALAIEHGALGMVVVSALDDRARVGTCHPRPQPEPGVVVTGADGTELANRLAASQSVRLNIRIVADAWPCEPRNVVAEIPGSGPEGETVIFCAHLDSWHLGEGAIDNGNGSVAILEAARALAAVSWRPRRTVRFIWFMGEEHGLFGSEAYVAAHAGELDKIVAVVNADMPGSPRQFAVFGHPEIVNWLQSVGADLAGLEISGEIADASWTASDHGPFMKQGVCAIALSGDLGEGVRFYHAAGDSYEVVDRRGTNLSAAAFAVVARRLADVSPRPTVRLDPAKLAELRRWDES